MTVAGISSTAYASAPSRSTNSNIPKVRQNKKEGCEKSQFVIAREKNASIKVEINNT